MRILLVSALYPSPAQPRIIGGAELAARRLADALAAAGHEIVVLRASPPDEAWLEERGNGLRIISRPIRRAYWPFDGEDRGAVTKLTWHARDDIGDAAAVRRLIDDVRPDVVHSHNVGGLSTGVWRAAESAGVPIVHTLHDYYLLCPRTSRFRDGSVCATPCRDCRLLTMRRRANTALVGDVVGVSRAVLQPHLDGALFSRARYHVVPNIIPPELVAAPRLSEAPVTFGFLGRITVEKGVERLVEAFGAMHRDARLVFGGRIDDVMRARLLALAGGRVIDFLGFVSPVEFFRAIDVLVVPSIWEDPLPTVILEGQTVGVPTLGARRGGIPEAIGSDKAGWTYDPDTQTALGDLLNLIAANPADIKVRAAAAHALAERFYAATVTSHYEMVYSGAVSQN